MSLGNAYANRSYRMRKSLSEFVQTCVISPCCRLSKRSMMGGFWKNLLMCCNFSRKGMYAPDCGLWHFLNSGLDVQLHHTCMCRYQSKFFWRTLRDVGADLCMFVWSVRRVYLRFIAPFSSAPSPCCAANGCIPVEIRMLPGWSARTRSVILKLTVHLLCGRPRCLCCPCVRGPHLIPPVPFFSLQPPKVKSRARRRTITRIPADVI